MVRQMERTTQAFERAEQQARTSKYVPIFRYVLTYQTGDSIIKRSFAKRSRSIGTVPRLKEAYFKLYTALGAVF